MPRKKVKVATDLELSQSDILDQLIAYKQLSHEIKAGNSRHALSPEMKTDFYLGSCRAFSFLNGYMRRDGHKSFWDFCLRKVAMWDREPASLDNVFKVPGVMPDVVLSDEARELKKGEYIINGVGVPEECTLKAIIKMVERNIHLAQSKRKCLIPNYNGATDFRFGEEMKYIDMDGNVGSFSRGGYVVGNFDVMQFEQIINEPNFKKALHGGRVCLLYSNNHACELYMSANGKYYFYNPNYRAGKAKGFNDVHELFYAIDRSLGAGIFYKNDIMPEGIRIDLSIEITGNPIQDDPFVGYYKLLAEAPFDLISFNNRKKKLGDETNFAVEWYYADEPLREKLTQSLSCFLNDQVSKENKKLCDSAKNRAIVRVMKAAIQCKDFKWLSGLTNISDSLPKAAFNEVVECAATKAEKAQAERMFNKHKRIVEIQSHSHGLSRSTASFFPKKPLANQAISVPEEKISTKTMS